MAQQNWVDSHVGAGLLHGGASQCPPPQYDVSPVHVTPQPPQFKGSLSALMQAPLQHFVNWLHAGEQSAPPELEPELEPLDPPEPEPLDPPEPRDPPEPPLVEPELPPELDPLLEEPPLLLLPPSFPPLPSTEASELPLRTSVAPPQCAKRVMTASIPVIPNK